MKPKRPDSAKSTKTRVTHDSDLASKDLNASKFSETFSSGVNKNKDDFQKYVQEKNKDPHFKKFLQPTLPQIPQKAQKAQKASQLSKLTSKPFERKSAKREKQKEQVKVEQVKRRQENQTTKNTNNKGTKFIEQSKKKLELLRQSSRCDQQKKQKSKISFNGFSVNIPGKGKKIIQEDLKQEKKKQQQQKQSQQMKQRRRNLENISNFINQVQIRNLQYFPVEYDHFVQFSQHQNVSIQDLNINNFLKEPNEFDLSRVRKNVEENDKVIEEESIDLDEMIDGDQQEKQNQSFALSYMTSEELRDRNMFVTEIMKGKLKEEDIMKIEEGDKTKAKIIKMEKKDKNQKKEEQEDQIQILELEPQKKKSNKFIQRNKAMASGKLYRQCDYLSEEDQRRLQNLLEGSLIQSPFIFSEREQFQNRRIDEGINIYREFAKSIEEDHLEDYEVIPESNLPKDPFLRQQAQMKIIRQKVASVNNRLRDVDEVVVNKTKIKKMIQKYKQITKVTSIGESMILEKEKQFNQLSQKLEQAEQLLNKTEQEKEQIAQILSQIQIRFKELEKQVKKVRQMDEQEIYDLELQQLHEKKGKIKDIEKQVNAMNQQIFNYELVTNQLQSNIQMLNQICSFSVQNNICENHNPNQTIEDLDDLITKKWESVEQAVRNIDDLHNDPS